MVTCIIPYPVGQLFLIFLVIWTILFVYFFHPFFFGWFKKCLAVIGIANKGHQSYNMKIPVEVFDVETLLENVPENTTRRENHRAVIEQYLLVRVVSLPALGPKELDIMKKGAFRIGSQHKIRKWQYTGIIDDVPTGSTGVINVIVNASSFKRLKMGKLILDKDPCELKED